MRFTKLFFILFLVSNVVALQAQKKERAYLKLYFQNTDNTPELKAELKTRIDKKFYPIVGATLTFTVVVDEAPQNLGTITTNNQGVALLKANKAVEKLVSSDDKVYFEVAYAGSDTIKKATKAIEIIPLQLQSEIQNTDTLAHITISATVPDTVTDLKGQTAQIFVRRLFGLQKLGETELNARGHAHFEFSLPIPAATNNLDIIVTIDDDDFGIVQSKNMLQLSTPDTAIAHRDKNKGGSYFVFMLISLIASYFIAFLINKLIHK